MKTFIFDFYNTLVNIRTDEHCEKAWLPVVDFLRERGMDCDWTKLCELYDAGWGEELDALNAEGKYAYPEGDITRIYKRMAEKLGGALSDADAVECAKIARRASIEWLRVFDGTEKLLDTLHARGARVYLLSNAQASFTEVEIEMSGLGGRFDGQLLSSDYGCRKPDPAFFDILFKKYKLKKSDAVMIGDDPENDGRGAANYNIRYIKADGGAAAHADEILRMLEL